MSVIILFSTTYTIKIWTTRTSTGNACFRTGWSLSASSRRHVTTSSPQQEQFVLSWPSLALQLFLGTETPEGLCWIMGGLCNWSEWAGIQKWNPERLTLSKCTLWEVAKEGTGGGTNLEPLTIHQVQYKSSPSMDQQWPLQPRSCKYLPVQHAGRHCALCQLHPEWWHLQKKSEVKIPKYCLNNMHKEAKRCRFLIRHA